MALSTCQVNGKDGFKHGAGGTCFTHDGSETGKQTARKKAIKEGLKSGKGGSLFSEERPWWDPPVRLSAPVEVAPSDGRPSLKDKLARLGPTLRRR